MYVARPLSHYQRFPELLSQLPEGPNSGFLVLQDEESETTLCCGLCKNRSLKSLPFPQNKNLVVRYSSGSGEDEHVSTCEVALIPVLNQPLSSGLYYAIKPRGSHKGEAYACSKEEDMRTGCFCNRVRDVGSRPFDPNDIYQQFRIVPCEKVRRRSGGFHGISVAPGGFPPNFLGRKGWYIRTKTPKSYELGEALGINNVLRARLPESNFPLSYKNSAEVSVGKWYCPFMFVRDGKLKDQMKRSSFYKITLKQHWEQIFECVTDNSRANFVTVDVELPRAVVFVGGREAVYWDESNVAQGMVWYRSFGGAGKEVSIGLSSLIVNRMKWEQERAGWVSSENRQVRVRKTEAYAGTSGLWNRFGCYVLVESFVLKRMDRSLALTYNFRHTHQIRTKWE